jgi:hypothetical protein
MVREKKKEAVNMKPIARLEVKRSQRFDKLQTTVHNQVMAYCCRMLYVLCSVC